MDWMVNCVRRTRCHALSGIPFLVSELRVLTLIRCGTLLDPGFMDSQYLYEVARSI
jgi:hypothetical protein